jgi:hypothetical protein
MVFRRPLWACLLLPVLCFACRQAAPEDTPEATVRAFVSCLSNHDLEAAAQLCTPAKRAYLLAWQGLMADSLASGNASGSAIDILSLNCVLKGDTARCICRERDAYETYEANYLLLRWPEGWRIDQPADEPASETEPATRVSQEVWPTDSLATAREKWPR